MATLGSTKLTYSDWAKRLDPDGSIPAIVEILEEINPIIEDAIVLEGNLATGHRTTVRSGLPSVAWRMLNYGVQPSKSTTVTVTDNCGMLEAYSEVDKDLADLNGNTAEFRMTEDSAFIEAMSQELASTIFYGNPETDPKKFLGIAPRFASTAAENGGNIVLGGGAGADNTSIYMITWDPTICHLIFPKGKKAGLQNTDLGEDTLTDAAGGKYQGYRTHYKWDVGLTVRDWRNIVRIANIDVSELADAGESGFDGAELILLMITAYNKIKHKKKGRKIIYVNTTVKTALDKLATTKSNVQLTIQDYAGQPTTMFWGIPIHECDAILDTEDLVS